MNDIYKYEHEFDQNDENLFAPRHRHVNSTNFTNLNRVCVNSLKVEVVVYSEISVKRDAVQVC